MNPLFQYWYFHLPNFVLAAIMYTLLGRLLLGLFVPPDWKNYIWRAFVRITEPVVRVVRFITPQAFPDIVVLIFAVFWVWMLRIAVYSFFSVSGLAPGI